MRLVPNAISTHFRSCILPAGRHLFELSISAPSGGLKPYFLHFIGKTPTWGGAPGTKDGRVCAPQGLACYMTTARRSEGTSQNIACTSLRRAIFFCLIGAPHQDGVYGRCIVHMCLRICRVQ